MHPKDWIRVRAWAGRAASMRGLPLDDDGFAGRVGRGSVDLARANETLVREADEHRRRAEASREEVRLLALVAEVSRAFAVRQELRPALQACATLLVQHLEAAFARVWTTDETGQWLELQASAGLYTHVDGIHSRVAMGALKIGLIAQTQTPHLTNAVKDDDRIDGAWADREKLVAFVGYPLVADGHTVGVAAAFSKKPLSEAVLHVLANVADVMALGIVRRQEEERRLRERVRYVALISSLSDVVWAADRHGRVIDVSSAVLGLTGYSPAEVLAGPDDFWFSRVHPEDLPRVQREYERLLAGRGPYDVEYRFRHRDGTWNWLHDRAFASVGADGRPFLEGLCSDITRQRQAEERLQALNADLEDLVRQRTEALAQTERRYRAFFEQDLSAAFVTDRQGRVLDCNRAFARYLGYATAAEARGQDLSHVTKGAAISERGLLATVCRHRRLEGCELAVRRRDGSSIDVLANLIGEFDGARLRHVRGYLFDISDRKQAERVLRELPGRILAAQDEERRRIARELHDSTAQNLAALAMTLSLIQRRNEDLNPATHALVGEAIRLAEESAREIRTTSYLLHPPLLEEAGLEAALRWYCEGFARRSGLQISVEVTGTPDLDGDAALAAYRTVQEALMNAYRHSGGTRAAVILSQDEGEVAFEVRDEGCGIMAAAGEHSEAGVGIAGMRERLSRLGGRLTIASSGAGTRVRGTIPRRS
jgi:PAS domain S-box-containing protein